MLLLNPDESLGRIQARRTLGLAIESKCVYVQLGAGNINDIDHDLEKLSTNCSNVQCRSS